jgi:hypothetical protein
MLDVLDRHMSFDDVAPDFRGVAGAFAVRNAEALLDGVEIVFVAHCNLETRLAQMVDP